MQSSNLPTKNLLSLSLNSRHLYIILYYSWDYWEIVARVLTGNTPLWGAVALLRLSVPQNGTSSYSSGILLLCPSASSLYPQLKHSIFCAEAYVEIDSKTTNSKAVFMVVFLNGDFSGYSLTDDLRYCLYGNENEINIMRLRKICNLILKCLR